MNIASCDDCGVVLDKDKLNFADDIYLDDGCVDCSKATWNGDNFVPFVKCPVCGGEILK